MNSRFVYAIISIVLSALIAFIAIPALNAKTSGKAEVVRVTQPIIKGMPITGDTIEVVEVGGFNLPENVAATTEDVLGMYATADLQPGDFILSSKVSFIPLTSDIQLNNLPSGMVAISVTVKTLASGLSDKLQPDDIIRFYHFIDFSMDMPELQFVRVLSVTDAKGVNVDNTVIHEPESEEEKQQTATITVLASPYQAQVLTGLENEGALHVALVSRGNAELAESLLQAQEEYFIQLEEEARLAEEAENTGNAPDSQPNDSENEDNSDGEGGEDEGEVADDSSAAA